MNKKEKIKKIFKNTLSYSVGSSFALTLIFGVMLFFIPNWATITISIIIMCLSIASGMLFYNPLSVYWLIIGICMVAIPWKTAMGIVFICLGIVGATGNLLVFLKLKKTA